MKHLILGGVKSGKSRFAEQCAAEHSKGVAVIATAEPLDKEMQSRIKAHQEQRPKSWKLLEAPVGLASALLELEQRNDVDVIIVDCLTLWLTNLLVKSDTKSHLDAHIKAFEAALGGVSKEVFIVSNETNMGVMPMDALSRKFCDESGQLHQRIAALCDKVTLMVAGLPLNLKG